MAETAVEVVTLFSKPILTFTPCRIFDTKKCTSQNGQAGGSNNQTGKSGEDLIIQVPCGTIIKNIENQTIIKDLIKEDESYIICNGGIGGKGNVTF